MRTGRILVVDDEESVREMLKAVLSREGHEVITGADGQAGLDMALSVNPDVILMDMRMPRLNGLEVYRALRSRHSASLVIFMTAFAAVESAVEVMKIGAYDYLIKPFNIDEVKILVRRAVESRFLLSEANMLRRELTSQYHLDRAMTQSPRMRQVYDMVDKVAPTTATVLITGESGTGKELLVNRIHYASARAKGPLVKINCSALPESLLESELFGHEKGAFTNAFCRRVGRFELADKGTLFFDEIGEMPPSLQVKLLRVLQEREFERLGGNETVRTDIRVLAATNRDLSEMVQRGEFREDLYYRLAVVNVVLPPLRERREDIMLLARLFLQKFARDTGRELDDIDAEAQEILQQYHWPGNVRELSNIMERAVIMSTGRILFAEDIAPHIKVRPDAPMTPPTSSAWQGKTLRDILKETECNIIGQVLRLNKGNKMKTARDLDMSRRALQYKIDEYGLED